MFSAFPEIVKLQSILTRVVPLHLYPLYQPWGGDGGGRAQLQIPNFAQAHFPFLLVTARY